MKSKLENLKKEILEQLRRVADISDIQNLEKKYLSKKGELIKLIKGIKDLPAEQRKEAGKMANSLRAEIEQKITIIKQKLGGKDGTSEIIDVTLPGEKIAGGSLHPLTLAQRDLEKIFNSMGFIILDGPELESEYYNFEALNIPATHPARDMQDTFYIDGHKDLVMRTHTSNVQVRAMEKYGAPLRCVSLGKVYRNEATDARHEHTFYQIEGLMVDEKISLANLINVLQEMLSRYYGQELKARLRPGYFPFVEPGAEVEMSCVLCNAQGCKVCKGTGWIEMLGAGLVHPNVLKYGGIDPKKYQGFAFGTGIERLTMLKYGIDDIRLFHGGDLHFLSQF